MNPHRYLAVLGRNWWLVVATTVLGCLAAFGLSAAATPQYTAKATMFFAQSSGISSNELNQGATYTQNQMQSFAQLAESPTVLLPVISALGLDTTPDDLAKSITVTTPQNTVIMEAAATNTDPILAAHIANQLARSITKAVTAISPLTADKTSSMSVKIIATATTPTAPSSPDTERDLLAGGLIGLLIGALVLLLRARFDYRVHSVEVLDTVTSAPLLGTLTRQREGSLLTTERGHGFQNLQSHRRMAAYLSSIVGQDEKLSLLVTSSIPGEGKSPIALGLANAFAERGRRVLVVDTDLRQPGLARITGLNDSVGLTSVLSGEARFQTLVNAWGHAALDVLVAGPTVPQPGVLIASHSMIELVGKLKAKYDVLVLDAAPVNSVADALILGTLVDGTVMVADSTAVVTSQLASAMDSMTMADVAIFGIVLNRVRRSHGIDTYPVRQRRSMRSVWQSVSVWIATPSARKRLATDIDAAIETSDVPNDSEVSPRITGRG